MPQPYHPAASAARPAAGPQRKPFAALCAGALGIGFAAVLAKLAVAWDGGSDYATRLSPVAVAFWRMALATPVFVGAAAWRRRRAAAGGVGGRPWALLLPGLLFALDLGTWHWAFEFTSVANATLEANVAVVLVGLASWLWLKERFDWRFPVGAALAFAGMAALVGAGFGGGGDAWIGDLLGLGVAVFYTGYQLSIKLLVGRLPVLTVMAGTCAAGAVFLAVMAAVSPGRFVPATAAGWSAVVLLALVSQVFGQGLIVFGMSRIPAGLASVVLVLQPLATAVLGWLLLGQRLAPQQLAAGGVVLAGIYLARRGSLPPAAGDA